MAAAKTMTRANHKKVSRPFSPCSPPSSSRLANRHHHLHADIPKRASTAQQLAPHPASPLLSIGRERRWMSRSGSDEIPPGETYLTNNIWDHSQELPFSNSSRFKRTPDPKDCTFSYPSSTKNIRFSTYPGPGAYNANMRSSGPSYSMGTKQSERHSGKIFSPGPGAYDVVSKGSGPSFSMAPKVRTPVTQRELNPGPGTYTDVYSAFNSGGVSFPSRERFK